MSDYRYCSECNRKTVSGDSYGRAYCRECGSFYDDSEMNDREKKIAEVLDLSKPVSDCPECGGLGEIRSLGSRRKCECLYIRLKTLKRELDRRDEENRKLRKERDDAREQAQKYYRKFEDEVAEIFQLQDELRSAQQEIERLQQERDTLIGGLRYLMK